MYPGAFSGGRGALHSTWDLRRPTSSDGLSLQQKPVLLAEELHQLLGCGLAVLV